jgi:hypothetical protein
MSAACGAGAGEMLVAAATEMLVDLHTKVHTRR